MSLAVAGSLSPRHTLRYPAALVIPSRYLLRRELHSGSFRILHVYDTRLHRDCALKTFSADTTDVPAACARLKAEYTQLAGLQYPSIVEVHELHDEPGGVCFTMELIDGTPLPAALTRDRGVARVCDLFVQLAGAVHTFHRRDLIHRDLAPAHARVDPFGRVVLASCEHVTPRGRRGDLVDPRQTREHLPYLAPEAHAGDPPADIDAPEDWYAFGVMLHEAFSGALPFLGEGPALLADKRRGGACPLPGLPADLAALIVKLLAPDPADRPLGPVVFETLQRHATLRADALPNPTFVNRTRELAALQAAHARAAAGPVVAFVHGASGIGKTAMIEHFLAGLPRRSCWLLRNQCHPSRHVNFHAIDGLVEEIGQILRRTPKPGELVPERPVPELLRVFRTLDQAPVFKEWPRDDAASLDVSLRRRAIAGLREILRRLAQHRPLLLWIDDVQWAGPDSAAVLAELLHGVEFPCLLLLSFRSEDRRGAACVEVLTNDPDLHAERVDVELPPLARDVSDDLLRSLMPRVADADPAVVDRLIAEAADLPFLLVEMAHLRAPAAVEGIGVAAVVRESLQQEPAIARDLLKLLAVAGRPLTVGLARKVLGPHRLDQTAFDLSHGTRLLRPAATAVGEEKIEIYHDRIRVTLLAGLSPQELADLHLQLAEAMISEREDPFHILNHLRGAGDTVRAAEYAEKAADRASTDLAFKRAAELYQAAIELGCTTPRFELHVRRAEALANAGHGDEAGRAFLRAIEEAPRSPDAQRWRLRAAEEFLHSGHVAEGMETLRAALAHVEVELPISPTRGMLESLRHRLGLLVLGANYTLTDEPAAPDVAARLDALWTASTSLAMINHHVADVIGVRHLVEALRLGHRSRVVRSLGFEAAWEAALGGRMLRARSLQMAEDALTLARGGASAYDLGWAHLSAAATRWFCADWRRTVDEGREALRCFKRTPTGSRWESSVIGVYVSTALAHLGRLRELQAELPGLGVEALERGDLFAANNVRLGAHTIAWLAQDDPGRVLADAAAAMAVWPDEPFSSQHYYHTLSTVHADLYRGAVGDAAMRLESTWKRLESAHFLRIDYIAAELWFLRGRVALAQLHRRGDTRKLAARAIRSLRDGDLPVSPPFHAVLTACLAAVDGAPDRARAALLQAIDGFTAIGMELHAAAAGLELAGLGGPPGAGEQARMYMQREGVARPERLARMLVPVGPIAAT